MSCSSQVTSYALLHVRLAGRLLALVIVRIVIKHLGAFGGRVSRRMPAVGISEKTLTQIGYISKVARLRKGQHATVVSNKL